MMPVIRSFGQAGRFFSQHNRKGHVCYVWDGGVTGWYSCVVAVLSPVYSSSTYPSVP